MELICLCLAVSLCLKMDSKSMVLVWLLQIGANDLTVSSPCSANYHFLKVQYLDGPSGGVEREAVTVSAVTGLLPEH